MSLRVKDNDQQTTQYAQENIMKENSAIKTARQQLCEAQVTRDQKAVELAEDRLMLALIHHLAYVGNEVVATLQELLDPSLDYHRLESATTRSDIDNFVDGFTCSETVCACLRRLYDLTYRDLERYLA